MQSWDRCAAARVNRVLAFSTDGGDDDDDGGDDDGRDDDDDGDGLVVVARMCVCVHLYIYR